MLSTIRPVFFCHGGLDALIITNPSRLIAAAARITQHQPTASHIVSAHGRPGWEDSRGRGSGQLGIAEMALPSILRVRRRAADATGLLSPYRASCSKEASPAADSITKADIRSSTKPRRAFTIVASLSYLISFVFLI